jgi:hypothetical protein
LASLVVVPALAVPVAALTLRLTAAKFAGDMKV